MDFKNSGFFGKAWAKTIVHAQENFAKYQKYELWGLFIFMSLPIPIWWYYGRLIAFYLGYARQKSLALSFGRSSSFQSYYFSRYGWFGQKFFNMLLEKLQNLNKKIEEAVTLLKLSDLKNKLEQLAAEMNAD